MKPVYSFNFVDFDDIDEPTKLSVASGVRTKILKGNKVELTVNIELHFAYFNDNLIKPIDFEDQAEDNFASIRNIEVTESPATTGS